MNSPYPSDRGGRNRWILAQRPNLDFARSQFNVYQPSRWLIEDEPDAPSVTDRTLTVFLRNRECPWRCLMCDLWQQTTPSPVPAGAIPAQIDWTFAQLREPTTGFDQLKLYNAGSFFDPQAIPPGDFPSLIERCGGFKRLVVESHPALIGNRCRELRRDLSLTTALEIAMGLETVHPEILEKLNKGMTLASFRRAADGLKDFGASLRVFVLVQPPFLSSREAVSWGQRSIDFAFDCGARVVSLIPTRAGNGALEVLAQQGSFAPPTPETVEAVWDYGLRLKRGLVLVDLWDLDRLVPHARASTQLRERWTTKNLLQCAR